MKWFSNRDEIEQLRRDVDRLTEDVKLMNKRMHELENEVLMYETASYYRMLMKPISTVPINKVVSGIVDHLGLEVRKERAKPETVTVTKREDGQAARP